MKYINGYELKELLSSVVPKIFLYHVANDSEHPLHTNISCAVIKTKRDLYFTSFSHYDYPTQDFNDIYLNNCYTFDLKTLRQLNNNGVVNCYDLGYDLNVSFNSRLESFLSNKIPSITNNIIPIFKLLEPMVDFISSLDINRYSSTNFNHTVVSSLFDRIEREELKVDVDKFINKFGTDKGRLIHDGYVTTQYNLYTNTGRPTNKFGGINYSALNKSDDTRECFISRHDDGYLVNIDFNSYHLYLIANELGIALPTDPHTFLGKMYFNKENLTEQEYEESKRITFKNLYGYQLDDTVKDISFFREVQKLQDVVWYEYKTKGYLTSFTGKKIIVDSPSRNKVFNYYIQSLETEKNIEQLQRLIDNKLIPCLYTYDSFLFDSRKDDVRDIITKASYLLDYPFTVSIGKNYKYMKKLSF